MDKGLKTLLSYFRDADSVTEGDIAAAKQEGYMFDYPQPLSHKETMKRLGEVLAKIERKDVSNAFLFSLSTRRLEYRSALGSYYFAKSIPAHEFSPNSNNYCEVCGFKEWESEPSEYERRHGLNSINYWRYKYGALSMKLNNALFDLEQFVKLPPVSPVPEDIEILRRILKCTKYLPKVTDKSPKLTKAVIHEKLLKTNKNEVDRLLETLSICGILNSPKYPSMEEKYVNYKDILYMLYSEVNYPLNMWCAYYGVNEERFKAVFGFGLNEEGIYAV